MVTSEERHRRCDEAPHRRGAALAELHKALKAMGFYPPGHPLRAESLRLAFGALRDAMGGEPLLLAIGKGGFTSAGGAAAVGDNPMVQDLARELFIRRVRRLAFLPDLSPADLETFLVLVTIDHRTIPSVGGMEALMAQRGITTIWVNEIDLTAMVRKQQELRDSFAAAGAAPPVDEASLNHLPGPDPLATSSLLATGEPPAEESPGQAAVPPEELIARMAVELDDERYRELARAFVKECGRLQENGEFERLLPLLELLLGQANDGELGLVRRGRALLAFDQVVGEGMIAFLVQRLETEGGREGERLVPLFVQLGSRAVVPLAERLRCADGARRLKGLAAALVALGDEASTTVLELLADDRPPVVRAAAEILGESGARGCEAALRRCLGHPDEGVRREAVRSLVRIGGAEAEEALIDCLQPSRDPLLRYLAVISLGTLRSSRAVEPLLAVVTEGDLFLRTYPLKKEALVALGKIGDRRAVPSLVALLGSRRWFPRRRGEDLCCQVAAVLGRIGDPALLPLLGSLAAKVGRLGAACGAAASAIAERWQGGPHG